MLNKHPQWTNRYSSYLIVSALLLLGLGLRLYQLGRTLGGGDENEILTYYVFNSLSYITTTYIENYHHVFHTILLHCMAMGFGGENEYAIRAPAFISGAACLWMIYKTALKLFDSIPIARLSLLLAAISPIHIYYSQTARGYSLSTFLSIVTVYAAVMLLDVYKSWRWSLVLVICGFFAVYTIPLNSIFIFCLGTWMFYVSINSKLSGEFDFRSDSVTQRFLFFLILFLSIALLSFIAYMPLMHDLFRIAEQRYLNMPLYESRIDMAINLIPDVTTKFFPGLLKWFSLFILLGIFIARPVRSSYKFLPIFVFLMVYLIPLIVNVTWFPRAYLFCFPLMVTFLSAGIMELEGGTNKNFNWSRNAGKILIASLIILYVVISSNILVSEYYPSLKIPNGKLLKQNIQKHSDPLDLIIVADPKDYYYARGTHSENLSNILQMNQLSGVKIVATDYSAVQNYTISDGVKGFPVFQNLIPEHGLEGQEVQTNLKMFSLSKGDVQSALPEDFESMAQWRIVRGNGLVEIESSHKLAGKKSLKLKADSRDIFGVMADVPGVFKLEDNTLMVLLYGGYNPTGDQYGPKNILVSPSILVRNIETGQNNHLRLGAVDFGVRSKVQELTHQGEAFNWNLIPHIGIIPPGQYGLSLHLRAPSGQSVLYDGLRLFLVNIPKTQ